MRDKAPDAWDKQVERLLASPHYGERWGRLWLDAARYADSDGFEKDKPRTVWFYRDWVVGAFNQDMPYDRFVIEQLAGDLLPHPTESQLVATGFLRNSMINEEGGVDPEQFRMEAMFDRMDAVGKSVLGLTIQCAQCHNHKFDPLKQEEYYGLFAFLNSSNEGSRAVYTPAEEMKRGEIFRKIREIEADLQEKSPDWADRLAAWEKTTRNDQPEWTVVRPAVDDISTGGCKYLPLEDGSFLAQSYAPTKHRVQMSVKTDLQERHGVPPRAPERPEPAAGGTRPLHLGHGRAHRVRSGRGARERAGQVHPREDRDRHRRREPEGSGPRGHLRRQIRAPTRYRAHRLRHRWKGRNGLGHRRGPGAAQPAPQGGVRGRGATSRVTREARSSIST